MTQITFLNVDLEIEAHKSLQPLADYFGEDTIVLICQPWGDHFFAAFEIAPPMNDADTVIESLCSLVESLDGDELELWNSAFRREFNIGYESGLEPRCYESKIRAETLRRVSAVGASITITIYPPSPEEHQPEEDPE